MAVTVKFFASLSERLGRSEEVIKPKGPLTVREVWAAVVADEPVPENVLIAVNMEYARPDAEVSDGDEVAFFPPVTGG
ncbi:MAG: MoaD/ThiS family protein [Gammaproteobacteria bacterium]|nr:MoaD/ThiS family protein [Gammaproteobacteria bacterium]MCI0590057.1 MoaD/ThiS family protein [Gammaproteobacteria bacterium]